MDLELHEYYPLVGEERPSWPRLGVCSSRRAFDGWARCHLNDTRLKKDRSRNVLLIFLLHKAQTAVALPDQRTVTDAGFRIAEECSNVHVRSPTV